MVQLLSDFPAQTVNAAGTTIQGPVRLQDIGDSANAHVEIIVTTITGTSPTLTVSIQWSEDGTNFADPQAAADALTAITATGNYLKSFPVEGKWFQLKCVAGGTVTNITWTAEVYTQD
jgi:hypothetical protein